MPQTISVVKEPSRADQLGSAIAASGGTARRWARASFRTGRTSPPADFGKDDLGVKRTRPTNAPTFAELLNPQVVSTRHSGISTTF